MAKSRNRKLPSKSRLPLTKKVVWEAKGDKPPELIPDPWLRAIAIVILLLLVTDRISGSMLGEFAATVIRGAAAVVAGQ